MGRKVIHYHRAPWGDGFAACGKRATEDNSIGHVDRVNCCVCLQQVITAAFSERATLVEKLHQGPVSKLIELARILEPKTPVELLSRALMREASAHMLRCEVRLRQIKVRPAKGARRGG
jgi:hypothetical protein